MNAESIARGLRAVRSGSGWMAKCPAHPDRKPSLSLGIVDGKTLVHCHAGCTQKAVIDALVANGLWSSERAETPRIVAEYSYRDESGRLFYQVVRYEPKDFKQRRPNGSGGWIWKKGERQILYHLKEVLEAAIVFVVEGEKDVETLREYGFVATTNAGGADARWLPQYTESLRGREVILIPDNDAAGRKRVARIAHALFGKVARLVVLELEGGAKDISGWFAQGRSELELISLIDGDRVSE